MPNAIVPLPIEAEAIIELDLESVKLEPEGAAARAVLSRPESPIGRVLQREIVLPGRD